MYIKQSFFALAMTALLTGCGGGGSSTSSEASASPQTDQHTSTLPTDTTTPPSAKKVAAHSGQVKDSSSGTGIAGVTVSIGSAATVTDEQGYYTLPSLEASEDAVVTFEKEGYLEGSRHILLKASSKENNTSNYLEFSMCPHDYQFDSNSTKEVKSPRIHIDASVYADLKGDPFNGTVAVKLTILDPEEKGFFTAFPGAFEGVDTNGITKQFESFGLITVLFEDSDGNALTLQEGETATLRFISVSLEDKPDTLPLWYYDNEQGQWFEEGYAQLQEDGSYKGDITHFGTWSLNKPLEEEAGIYSGRIVSEDGSPLSNVRLQALGTNWASSDLSTDENGVFEIKVIPGSAFRLTAYNYKEKFGASYNGLIPAIASGDVVDE
jgi:hypothetical protein